MPGASRLFVPSASHRRILHACLVIAIVSCAIGAGPAVAQTSDAVDTGIVVTPGELSPGENHVTIRVPRGILSIEVVAAFRTEVSLSTPLYCPDSIGFNIVIDDPSEYAWLRLRVRDCAGDDFQVMLRQLVAWRGGRIDLGELAPGDRKCVPMAVRAGGSTVAREEIVDTIIADDPGIELRFTRSFPVRLAPGAALDYTLCLESDTPRRIAVPVSARIRRHEGAGTFAIADTVTADVAIPGPAPVDPTTFRTIAVPNAIIPPRGRAIAGSYDLLGYLVGYVPFDGVMVMAGGMLPLPGAIIGRTGESRQAHSIGIKAGINLADRLRVAAGIQWGMSTFDLAATDDDIESTIDVLAPYGAITYGDDRGHLSLTAALGSKRHRTYVPDLDMYNDYRLRLAVIAVGGDLVVAHGWKLASEAAWMESAGVLPVGATVRYFTDDLAVEAGAVYLAGSSTFALAPLVSLLVRL